MFILSYAIWGECRTKASRAAGASTIVRLPFKVKRHGGAKLLLRPNTS
jgi:hypothetical protein